MNEAGVTVTPINDMSSSPTASTESLRPAVSTRPEWHALQQHFAVMRDVHMRDLFAADGARFNTFSVDACGLLLDYSKNRITGDTMQLLFALADACDVAGAARRIARHGRR